MAGNPKGPVSLGWVCMDVCGCVVTMYSMSRCCMFVITNVCYMFTAAFRKCKGAN